jgi:hypothetical protein
MICDLEKTEAGAATDLLGQKEPLLCISLWMPWAQWVIWEWKPIETRTHERFKTRAFTPPPDIEIWEWADENVLLQNEDAAEPGSYRSAKTPWTRRLQELIRRPEMWVWSWDPAQTVTSASPSPRSTSMKSSQSGFSEACLNGIRWRATYRPCNVIYAIDSADEAKKIARRLLRSLVPRPDDLHRRPRRHQDPRVPAPRHGALSFTAHFPPANSRTNKPR